MSATVTTVEPVTVVNVCRLCQMHCGGNRKCINGENSEMNEVYMITVKYFPAKFLEPSWSNTTAALCLECWRHIIEFHSFQELIFDTQKELLGRHREGDDVEITPGDVKPKRGSTPAPDIALKSEVQCNENGQNIDNKCVNVLNDDQFPCKEEYHIDISLSDLEDIDIQFSTDDEMSVSSTVDTRKEVDIKTHLQNPTKTTLQCNVSEDSQICDGKEETSVDHTRVVKDIDKPKCKPKLQCWICGKTRASFDLLCKHFVVNHPRRECYVTCCQLKLATRYAYEKHIGVTHPLQKPRQNTLRSSGSQDSQTRDGKGKKSVDHTSVVKDINKPNCKPKLQCWICGKTAATFVLLQKHFGLSHRRGQCYVTCCQLKFTSKKELDEHTGVKHNHMESFMCGKCKIAYPKASILKKHQLQKHTATASVQQFNCPECPKILSTSENLKKHYNSHFVCQKCNKLFETTDGLKSHTIMVHNATKMTPKMAVSLESFTCEKCGKTMNSKSTFETHERFAHMYDCKYKCNLCDTTYIKAIHFRDHMNYHSKDNYYACAHCSNKFQDWALLKAHMHLKHANKCTEKHMHQLLLAEEAYVVIQKNLTNSSSKANGNGATTAATTTLRKD